MEPQAGQSLAEVTPSQSIQVLPDSGTQLHPASAEPNSTAPGTSPGESSGGDPQLSQGPEQQNFVSIRDYAKANNVDLSRFQSDEEAINALFAVHQQLPQLEHFARYGREVLGNWQAYQQFLASRNQPQQQQQPAAPQQQAPAQAKGWWNPPASREEVEKIVQRYYERDAAGNIRPKAEAPPSLVQRVEEYQSYIADWENKLRHNPQAAIGDAVREEAQKVAQQLLQQTRTQDTAMAIVNRHAGWMFMKDPSTGVPFYGQYTPAGLSFLNYVQRADRMGIKDVHDQEHYALSMLTLEQSQQARSAQPQQPYQPQPAAAQQQVVQPPAAAAGNRIANYASNPPPAQSGSGLSLLDRIRGEMAASGNPPFTHT